jgi:hypothetical protein
MSTINTKGADAIGAVNTTTGQTMVTVCGKACTNKRNGEEDFDRGICHSASGNCYDEKETTTPRGKAMNMAKLVCDYVRGNPLPPGVTVSH